MLLLNKSYNTTVYNHFVDTLNIFTVIKKCCIDLSETNSSHFSLTG